MELRALPYTGYKRHRTHRCLAGDPVLPYISIGVIRLVECQQTNVFADTGNHGKAEQCADERQKRQC